jgi:hypothetical protein
VTTDVSQTIEVLEANDDPFDFMAFATGGGGDLMDSLLDFSSDTFVWNPDAISQGNEGDNNLFNIDIDNWQLE